MALLKIVWSDYDIDNDDNDYDNGNDDNNFNNDSDKIIVNLYFS